MIVTVQSTLPYSGASSNVNVVMDFPAASICNEGIILVAANLDFVGIRFTAIDELGFHAGFPDNSIQMSRSNNRKLIVRDDGVELLLGLSKTGNVIKYDFRFFMLLRALGDAGFDRVDYCQRTVAVKDNLYCIIDSRGNHFRRICAVVAVHGFRTAAPNKKPALDGYVIQHNFPIRRTTTNNQITVYGHILERHIVGTNENTALETLIW